MRDVDDGVHFRYTAFFSIFGHNLRARYVPPPP